MGVINHNSIIATTWNPDVAKRFHEWIASLNERERKLFVTAESPINEYYTFVMVPDGSNEGWKDSDDADELRNRVCERFSADNYGDGSSPWDWCEVGFGEFGQKVLRGNCENKYNDDEYYE